MANKKKETKKDEWKKYPSVKDPGQKTTKAPTGVAITRKGNKFIASWKRDAPNFYKGLVVHLEEFWGFHQGPASIQKEELKNAHLSTDANHRDNNRTDIQLVDLIHKPHLYAWDWQKWYPYRNDRFLSGIYVEVKGCQRDYPETVHNKRINDGKTVYSSYTRMIEMTWSSFGTVKGYEPASGSHTTAAFQVYPPKPVKNLKITWANESDKTIVKAAWTHSHSDSDHSIWTCYEIKTRYMPLRALYSWVTLENHKDVKHKYTLKSVNDIRKTFYSQYEPYAIEGSSWSNIERVTNNNPKTLHETFTPSIDNSRIWMICVRACGPGGPSDWVYAHWIWAKPKKPKIITYANSGTPLSLSVSGVLQCVKDFMHPVNSMDIQYVIAQPGANRSFPTGETWTNVKHYSVTGQNSLKTINKNSNCLYYKTDALPPIEPDHCLWIRAKSNYYAFSTAGDTLFRQSGGLKKPTKLISTNITVVDNTTFSLDGYENASDVIDSKLLVYIRRKLPKNKTDEKCVGIIEHGSSESKSFSCLPMANAISFQIGLKALVGTTSWKDEKYKEDQYSGTLRTYSITKTLMSSGNIVWSDSDISAGEPPKTVTVDQVTSTSVRLTWDWPWDIATKATISWSDDENAWESTQQPSMYTLETRYKTWIVGGLETGKTYYFRIKLSYEGVDSPWSETVSMELSTVPSIPELGLSSSIVHMDETIYFNVAGEGIDKTTYEIVEMVNGQPVKDPTNPTQPLILTHGSGSGLLSISVEDINTMYSLKDFEADNMERESDAPEPPDITQYLWAEGSTHYVAARAKTNTDGALAPQWGDTATVQVVAYPDPPSLVVSCGDPAIEIVPTEIQINPADPTEVKVVNALTEFPLTVTVSGTEGSEVLVNIVRYDDYNLLTPSETKEEKRKGDIVASGIIYGNGTVTFDTGNIVDILDDNSRFNIVATLTDVYGATAVNDSYIFEPHYTHQPTIPVVNVQSDLDYSIVKLTATKPEDFEEGDTIDIYRLSINKPMLIVQNGSYGTTYVDPYPALGEYSGHRIVAKTSNLDYTTSDGALSWTDVGCDQDDYIPSIRHIVMIDFEEKHIELPYNVTFSNNWSKDFSRTSYLGGSVTGDWNPAVTRDVSIETVGVDIGTINGDDTYTNMRALAEYAGICHVRTGDGSSFAANVEVSENSSYEKPWLISWSLNIQRVDSQRLDGMTLEEWNKYNGEGESS